VIGVEVAREVEGVRAIVVAVVGKKRRGGEIAGRGAAARAAAARVV
jgi:hypothetical protein